MLAWIIIGFSAAALGCGALLAMLGILPRCRLPKGVLVVLSTCAIVCAVHSGKNSNTNNPAGGDGGLAGAPLRGLFTDGLSPTNSADAYLDPDSDGLINLHEYWANCQPGTPDGSNTVLSIMARSVDERLMTNNIGNTKYKFNNYRSWGYGHLFVTNSNFWAKDVDTTCASVWNDFVTYGGFRKAGTLISRRHMIFANHFPAETNKMVWFVGSDGNSYSNTVVNLAKIGDTDIQVALLASDMDEHVRPARILPKQFSEYINTGRGLPVLAFDYDEHGIVYEIKRDIPVDGLQVSDGTICTGMPYSSLRRSYYENVVEGDSGDPCFLLLGTNVVFLGAAWYGDNTIGTKTYEGAYFPFMTYYAESTQETMDMLCPGYFLQYIDLHGYETLDDERGE